MSAPDTRHPDIQPQRVAVLGMGMMGRPMAQRLCQAGHTVTVWNRDPAKATPLAADGARVAPSAAEAVREADWVLTLLTDGDAVAAVLFEAGVAQAMKHGACVVDHSSIRPAQAREHAQRLHARGLRHIDAPVSGGTLGAAAGTLAIMAGGEAADIAQAAPLLDALGRCTHVGAHGSGQLAKLANQMIVGIGIGAVAEALLLAERGGADPERVRQALLGGFASSRVLEVHGQRMTARDFVKRGSVDVQLKDMRNALQTAAELGFQAPICQLLEALYEASSGHGDGDLDQAALFRELARRNAMA